MKHDYQTLKDLGIGDGSWDLSRFPGYAPGIPVYAYAPGIHVYAKGDAKIGYTTGGHYRCRLESCGGVRIATRWPDGKMTFPCTKGMEWSSGKGWVIL
jgi:hypothetical protein